MRTFLWRAFLLFAVIVLAGCAPSAHYIRADGAYASPETIEAARAACGADSKEDLCMMERGYFNVAASQAEAKRAQLASIAQTNEQERQAKAIEKERQAKAAAQAAERARKQALRKKKRRNTVRKPTSDRTLKPVSDTRIKSTADDSIWSKPSAFTPVVPVERR